MSEFAWDIKHYPTVADYQAALLPFSKPAWIKGITIHHTWKPTRAEWQGKNTMEFLGRFYQQKGWSAGPHLFLAADTHGPFTDGIWAGTPLAVQGVHAGKCNDDHIGVEVVGNYDVEAWPANVARLVYDVLVLLMRWGKIAPGQVHGHRECLPNKSCPGSRIIMEQVRKKLEDMLTPPIPRYRMPKVYRYDKRNGQPLSPLNSYTEYGVRRVVSGWGELGDGTGWIKMGEVERVPE